MYIPDLTERFPEGFGGVNMTAKYFPSNNYSDAYPDIDDSFCDYDIDSFESISPECEPKLFEIGQKYEFTDWFTGGISTMEVVARSSDTVTILEYKHEIDGEFTHKRIKKILKDDMGDEYTIIYEYGGDEARIYAY